MVRLVFRPYSHIRRTICTSVSLQASTRISSGFTMHTNRSPSFGSHHDLLLLGLYLKYNQLIIHYLINSNLYKISLSLCPFFFLKKKLVLQFVYFFIKKNNLSIKLAYMLDSLVRVSRREE